MSKVTKTKIKNSSDNRDEISLTYKEIEPNDKYPIRSSSIKKTFNIIFNLCLWLTNFFKNFHN